MDFKKALKDFWYGKPHTAEEGGRRLGETTSRRPVFTSIESGAA